MTKLAEERRRLLETQKVRCARFLLGLVVCGGGGVLQCNGSISAPLSLILPSLSGSADHAGGRAAGWVCPFCFAQHRARLTHV